MPTVTIRLASSGAVPSVGTIYYIGLERDQATVARGTADARRHIRATHTGDFFGLPATNRPVSVVANILMQVRDGRVVRLHGVFDEAGLLRQMGVLPG